MSGFDPQSGPVASRRAKNLAILDYITISKMHLKLDMIGCVQEREEAAPGPLEKPGIRQSDQEECIVFLIHFFDTS
jgi:hypothetical protein